MMELSVKLCLECAHKAAVTGKLHGHSYEVTVWFSADPISDIDCHAVSIREVAKLIDHTQLEESVGGSRMEDIAAWLMTHLSVIAMISISRVVIFRPSLGLGCELRK